MVRSTVSQVVHEYGDICQAVTELAIEKNARIDTNDVRRPNRCLDDAIAGAVTEYGQSRDDTINRQADDEDQRLVTLATKLQTAIQMANMARDVVKTGSVGISGSTSRLLDMSLHAAGGLVDSLLAEFSAKRPAIEPTQNQLTDSTHTVACPGPFVTDFDRSAGTLEAIGKRRYPIQIVATVRGVDVDRDRLFNMPDIEVWVLTVAAGASRMRAGLASRPWIRPLVMRRPEDLPEAFETLRTFGIERISCVGGRHLATQLIDPGLIQDVYLTTSARTGGEPGTPMCPRLLDAHTVVRARGAGADAGVVFEHRQLTNPKMSRG